MRKQSTTIRVLSLFLALMLVLSSINGVPITIASAESTDADSFNYIVLDGEYCAITGYTGTATEVVIPSEIDGYVVQKISDNAFKNNKTIEKVVLPETLETVGSNVFYGCTNLTNVEFGEKLTRIEEYMFYGCTSLAEMTIPNGITTIGECAFSGCTGLTEVYLPDTLDSIYDYAFQNCQFEKIDIPDSVTNLAPGVFYNCTKLSEVGYPAGWMRVWSLYYANEGELDPLSVGGIGTVTKGNASVMSNTGASVATAYDPDVRSPFQGCSSLKAIVVDEGVTIIPAKAFWGVESLEMVAFPESLQTIGSGTFEDCVSLKSIIFPSSMKRIGDRAFLGCTSLEHIVFPVVVTSIGDYAFSGCTALESAVFAPSSYVEFWGEYVFSDCSALTDVVLPASIIEMSSYTFSGCSKLFELTYPKRLQGCSEPGPFAESSICAVTILEGTTDIWPYCFSYCTKLEKVVLPDSVEGIGDRAFSHCAALTDIWIPENVCLIRDDAFINTGDLTIHGVENSYAQEFAEAHNIPFSTQSVMTETELISGYVLDENGKGIENVKVSLYNTTTGKLLSETYTTDSEGNWSCDKAVGGDTYRISFYHAYYQIPVLSDVIASFEENVHTKVIAVRVMDEIVTSGYDFTYKVLDGGYCAITGYTGATTEVVIPCEIDGYIVQKISDNTFRNNTTIEKVVLPDTLETVGSSVFSECTSLAYVGFNGNLTSIGDHMFWGCTSLTEMTIPNGITTIGKWAFHDCTGLTEVNLPESLVMIDEFAFFGCEGLTGIVLPDSVSAIMGGAFGYCTNLSSVELPISWDTCTPYDLGGWSPFGECTKLTEITFPEGMVKIPEMAFYECSFLEKVTFADSIVEIGSYAFDSCNGLIEIDLPESLTKIDSYAFYGCTGLTEIALPDSLTTINRAAFNGCSGLKSIAIPESLTTIEEYAFNRCSSLADVFYSNAEEQWNAITVGANNDPLLNATFHFDHTHVFGEWEVDYEPTCAKEGKKHKTCVDCGYSMYEAIEIVAHTYELEVVPPTYLEQGYTLYTCSVCGDTYKDTYVDPLDRIDLSNATLELEYTSAYYEGLALTPDVTLTYEGETFDSSKELKITYTNNNQVGTATVTIEGINRFEGTVELQFEISYEVIPEQIVNVIAIGEIGKVSLSWGESSEVNTDSYNIYRKADGETEYQLIKTINGRTVLSYEDKNVEKSKTYSYYVTGIGLYGAESEPSLIVTATVLVDEVVPTILKVSPAAATIISGETTLSATATDNIGVTKVAYFYTLDNGENWVAISETTNKAFSIVFDTSDLGSESVKVKAVAYDAEGNESDPITVVYSLDNVGPEKVTGLSAVTLSSKITLSWNDVTANDAAYFILQAKSGDEWTTVAKKITTFGYTITGLQPDTDYIYRVACVDTHGNIGEYSDEFTARTAVDETAPVITSQSPNSARYNSTIKFSATAKDDCDVETIEIQVSTDLSSWTTISTNTYTTRTYRQTYTYTIDLSSYAEGSIFVRAIATDFSGNISDTSDAAPYTEYIVDKAAPEAPTGISANGNDGYITVSWAMGNEGDLGKYFVYKSTSLDGNYQLIASNLSTLNYHDRNIQSGREFYYKVKVSDTCGNMSEYSNAASATMSPDTQSPEITSISSTYQQKISNSSHTINVAANDNNKLSYIVVEYCTSINPEYTQLVISENIDNHYKSISVTLPIDGLADGDVIHLRAYAVDMAGLRSEYAAAKYTLDTTPSMVEDFSALLDVSTVYLDWKDNRESDLSGFKVYRSVDGEAFTLLGSRGVSSTGSYSFIDTITDKESNTYIYKLESIDRLGNTASWLKSVDYTYVYVNQIPIAQMVIPDFMTVGVEEIFDASGSTDDIVIMSYLWDFGDGTTSTEMKPVKSYDAVGTYTVKLSVTDNEGITSTITKDIEVKERDLLGTLNVKVVDENGKALSYVPVYFDLGSDNQKIIYTNASGVATLQMLSGTHTIGMYASGYLPVKKDVVVLANATRTVTLTTVEEDIVTGNFEITRMTFDEIVAAGIDVYDPANQNVYSATVRVTYGSTPPLTINYVRNDDEIISYTIKESNGNPVTHYTNSNGENRKITGITYIPSSQGGSDVVAIMDIPAEASYLKEIFDVRLHIVNNASSEFSLEMNEVILNVPEGLTLMTSVSGDYSTSNTVKIDAIRGQETVTLAWVLRGDKAGEYDLSADFTGTLAEFNELVTARFETEEPIKVYGLEGVKFRILTADEIHNDTLYFNIELENERDIDIYMPSIGLTDKIASVTESVLNDNAEGDFFTEAYILNAYIQTENGQKQYVPVTYDANGRATTAIKTLAPGQKIVYEYVAYNAINYNGIAYFKEAAITEFEGVIDNIETGSFHKELYSFTDYSAKLDAILSGSDADVNAAFDYINTNGNYYYVSEAEDSLTNACQALYSLTDLALNADISVFTQEEQRQMVEQIVLSILADRSSIQMSEDLQATKYLDAVRDLIKQTKNGLIRKNVSGDLNGIFNEILGDSKELASTYMLEGRDAFCDALYTKLSEKAVSYSLSLAFDGQVEAFFNDIGISEAEAFSSTLINPTAFAGEVIDALQETQRDAYIAALLKMECNAEYSHYILDAIICNAGNSGMSYIIIDVAADLKQQINSAKTECYDYVGQFYANLGTEAGEFALKSALKLAIKSTPLSLAGKIFTPISKILNFDSFYKQQDALDVYNAMSKTMIAAFNDSVDTRDEDADFYSMCILKALCELRLSGEAEFKSFMNDYMEGKYALPLIEETVLKQINGVMNTSYTSIDEWYDDVQYNIVHARDILFNVESISDLETPRAPVVTLDYDKLQTVQTFTSEYEYCFADGAWKSCSNEPIPFVVGITPSILRVRKAAGTDNLAGNITTVRIYARKDLSKLITVRFDGVNYLVNNLSAQYDYQLIFTDSPDGEVDWNKAKTVAGSDSTVIVSGVGSHEYVIIRSCQNSELYEATSNPLQRTVYHKQKLDLHIEGSGSVFQPDKSGCYFVGDTVDLIASPYADCEFVGWYVNGVCVSTANYYLIEMDDNIQINAAFTGSKIETISVSKMPSKLEYGVGDYLDLNGLEIVACYDDGSSIIVEDYTARMMSNTVGTSVVEVSFGGKTTCYNITIVGDESDTTEPEKLKFSGASLTLQDDLTINFKVNQTLIEENGYENPYVVFSLNGVETKVSEYAVVNGKYVFDFIGIIPHQMNDTIYATLYATYNGVEYASETREYSIADYCYNMLAKYGTDEYAEFRTLLVDLMNYGAESQEYMDYSTNVLVNENLTEVQKAWGTSEMRTLVTVQDTQYKTIDSPSVLWKGAGLNLQKSVGMRFKIAADSIENLTVKVTNDLGQESIITSDTFEPTEGGYYVFFEGLNAGQMSDVVYLTVYEGDNAVSHTIRYSIESYAYIKQNGTDEKLAELVVAMMKYGDSAKAYVN